MFYCESSGALDQNDSLSGLKMDVPVCSQVQLVPEAAETPDYTLIDHDASVWGKDSAETEKIFQQANFVPSKGDILLFGDYKAGNCEKVIKDEETEKPKEPRPPRSLSNFLFANNVPKVSKEADYLNINDEWGGRFVYSEGPFTSVKDQRSSFSAYLRQHGILSIIADFIVKLEETPNTKRPPPEELLEHFLTHAGYTNHLKAKQEEAELKESQMTEKAKILEDINALTMEGNYLKSQVEEYEFLSPPCESLNPDEYIHLEVEEPYGDFQQRFWKDSKISGFTESDNPLNSILKKSDEDGGKQKDKKGKSKDKKDKSKDKKDKSKDKKDKKDKSKDKKRQK